MVARFGIAKQTLLIMILFFPLSFLRRQSKLIQSKIIDADNGNPDLFGNWTFCGNLTECIDVETYFAETADIPTETTQ